MVMVMIILARPEFCEISLKYFASNLKKYPTNCRSKDSYLIISFSSFVLTPSNVFFLIKRYVSVTSLP